MAAVGAAVGGYSGVLLSTPNTVGKLWKWSLQPNPRGTYMRELMRKDVGKLAPLGNATDAIGGMATVGAGTEALENETRRRTLEQPQE